MIFGIKEEFVSPIMRGAWSYIIVIAMDKLHKIPLMYGSLGGLIREGEYSSRTGTV